MADCYIGVIFQGYSFENVNTTVTFYATFYLRPFYRTLSQFRQLMQRALKLQCDVSAINQSPTVATTLRPAH